jgi:hypothetical protein
MYWLVLAILVVAALAGFSAWQRAQKRRELLARLVAEWGRPREKDRDPVLRTCHARYAETTGELDAGTWSDLDLDSVFAFLDRTESEIGQQWLYHRLRSTAHTEQTTAGFGAGVERLRADPALRTKLQVALSALAGHGARSLWDLALDPIDMLPAWTMVFPIFALSMLASIVLVPWFPSLVVVLLAGVFVGLTLRVRLSWRVIPLAAPFSRLGTLLSVGRRLAAFPTLPSDALKTLLATRLPRLAALSRLSPLLARDPSRTSEMENLVFEYLNLLFCIDANAMLLGVRALRRHQDDLREVLEAVSELDVMVSVASVRDGAEAWTAPQVSAAEGPVVLDDVRHPLVPCCVPNSLTFGPPGGVLLTGANMTGKSTFLRTVGLAAVLGQTIDTVFAKSYQAPWVDVGSCVSPRDDVLRGKSYYQDEAERVVALLTRAPTGRTRLCLFDEMFRGTNAADRIAASADVLRYLASARNGDSARSGKTADRCLVLAATHDLELVGLLEGRFAPYHFGDRITDTGLEFDYLLHPGPTTSRNALALLRLLGAPPEIGIIAKN